MHRVEKLATPSRFFPSSSLPSYRLTIFPRQVSMGRVTFRPLTEAPRGWGLMRTTDFAGKLVVFFFSRFFLSSLRSSPCACFYNTRRVLTGLFSGGNFVFPLWSHRDNFKVLFAGEGVEAAKIAKIGLINPRSKTWPSLILPSGKPRKKIETVGNCWRLLLAYSEPRTFHWFVKFIAGLIVKKLEKGCLMRHVVAIPLSLSLSLTRFLLGPRSRFMEDS